MNLIQKTVAYGASMYLLYPGDQPRTPFKRRSIALLMDDTSLENVTETMLKLGLDSLSLEKELIIYVPIVPAGAWKNLTFAQCRALYRDCEREISKPDPGPMETNEVGIPTVRAMMSAWHPMNDAKYIIGLGSGADAAVTLAACDPVNIAGVMADGGKLMTIVPLTGSAVPACLYHADDMILTYFRHSNGDTLSGQRGPFFTWASASNPAQCTFVPSAEAEVDAAAVRDVWEHVFAPVRRTNTCLNGDVEPAIDHQWKNFELFIEDDRLGDGKKHTWFTHIPECLRNGSAQKVPLIMFFHGGTDNPA